MSSQLRSVACLPVGPKAVGRGDEYMKTKLTSGNGEMDARPDRRRGRLPVHIRPRLLAYAACWNTTAAPWAAVAGRNGRPSAARRTVTPRERR
ncbi:hypothetical protein GCM10009830_39760 [Glycomyces endophyticus]|uniref:Uncharacterized protein n=1 Tax=Glycomyces endophyticus TaxID=480996 RepID=A0ABP4THU4_9ACTN